MNDEMTKVLNLKDMAFRVLKKWRGILLGAVVIALLLGIGTFSSGMMLLLDEDKLQEARDTYEIELSDYEATGERLRTTINNLKSDLEYQQWYNDTSVLMRIDPLERWEGSFTIYIDSRYQIDPSLSFQNTDRTYRLVSAYAGFLQSGEVYLSLMDALDYVDELSMLREIYSVSSDANSASVTVRVTGESEENVLLFRDAVKNLLSSEHTALLKTIGDHDYGILQESVFSVTDLNLDSQQKANRLKITEYTNQIGETQKELEKWNKQEKPKPEFGVTYTVKQTIKRMILGGVGGVFMMLAVYAVSYINDGTMKVDEDWNLRGIPLLGRVYRDPAKKFLWQIDCWVDRLFRGKEKQSTEGSCVLTASNLGMALKEQGLEEGVLTGDVETEFARRITELLNRKKGGVSYVYAGNALSDPETWKKMENARQVILLAEAGKTRAGRVNQTMALLDAWGKTILGVVVVD